MIHFFARLDEFMTKKGLNDNKITVETGISNGLIGKARKRGSLSQDNISKILYTYPELNANWLFRGIGDMRLELSELRAVSEPSSVYENILDNDLIEKLKLVKEIFGSKTEDKLDLIVKNQTRILDRLDRDILKDNIDRIKEDLKNPEKSNNK